MDNEPVSCGEKHGGPPFPHWMYVHELKSILDKLQPNDVLTPNRVANLAVENYDGKYIGYIDFFFTELLLDKGE